MEFTTEFYIAIFLIVLGVGIFLLLLYLLFKPAKNRFDKNNFQPNKNVKEKIQSRYNK